MIARKFVGLYALGMIVSFGGRDLLAQEAAPASFPAPSTRTAKSTDPLRAVSAASAPTFDPEVMRTQDPQPSPETRSAVPGSQAVEPFLQRFFEALFVEEP